MININDLPSFDDTTAEFRASFYTEYGNRMRRHRQAMGLSISDLSKKLKIPEQDLEKYESGQPVPFIECVMIYQTLGMRQ